VLASLQAARSVIAKLESQWEQRLGAVKKYVEEEGGW